jgi:hypothetical protein
LVTAAGEFLDGSAFLEGIEHFVEGVAVGAAHVQGGSDIVGGGGVAPNLQKTQYVIGA